MDYFACCTHFRQTFMQYAQSVCTVYASFKLVGALLKFVITCHEVSS